MCHSYRPLLHIIVVIEKNIMKVNLRVVSTGSLFGKTFSFDQPDCFTFGRASDCTCNVPPDQTTFSRHHFLIEVNPPEVWIKDLGSLNGTYINGKKYGGRHQDIHPENALCSDAQPLREGDIVKAGSYEFLVSLDALIYCVNCGKEVLKEERKAAEFVGGSYLCLDCRHKEIIRKENKQSPGEKISGKFLDDEIKLSIEMRKKAEDNPAIVIDELLKKHGLVNGSSKFPEIKGYRIEKELGRGGFGAVYLAVHCDGGKRVALKTLLQTRNPGTKQLEMFYREIDIARQLQHQNIVQCVSHGNWNEVHFMEMELMAEGSLWDVITQRGRVPYNEALPVMLQTLEGLAYAHSASVIARLESGSKKVTGVIHRDLKPSNILFSADSKNRVAKISDFGLSKAFTSAGLTKGSLTGSFGGFCGTPCYMAPEHLTNYRFIKPATDVFEIAATYYHMLTGKVVWHPQRGADIYRHILEGTIIPLKEIDGDTPKRVAKVIDKALSRNPDDRYINAGMMLKDLKQAQ